MSETAADVAADRCGSGPEDIEELRRRHAELELLYETIRDLSSTLSVRGVLERLLMRALAHLDAEIGSILILGPDGRLRITASHGLPPWVIEETRVAPGEGISGLVAEHGEPLLVRDIERDERFRRLNHERYYTSSFISAPLRHLGAVRGVINVNNKRSRVPFEPADLRLLEALAGHASAALANAHQYETVLDRAQRDSLTGLTNHGHFWGTLEVEFRRAKRYGHPLSLALFDVDHFKAFNDRFGHPAGDDALRAVARELERHSRAHDLPARYGGEEFAVLLPETPLDGARIFAEKIREVIGTVRVGPEDAPPITVSAGVAQAGEGVETPHALVELADARLYAAKAGGRDRVCADD
jgi:diguanylate cyclase (GGDEF)-like protein